MKKILPAAIVIAMALCLAGCSSGETASSSGTPAAEQVQTAEEVSNGVDEFTIEIGGCTLTEDYEGNPAIIVEYTWTNNNEEAQMFDVAVIHQAFQNGVQLDYAIVMSDEFDMDASMKEIKTGTTQTVYQAYLLDDMSEVSVELEGWLSDSAVAEKSFTLE